MGRRPKDPAQQAVQRAARALMQARGNALGQQCLRAVRPVGVEYDEVRAELVGSAVLVALGDRRFALTAGHVADWAVKGTLMLAGVDTFWAMPPLRTSVHPGGRAKDPYDVAVAELDPETVAGLGDVRFLEPDELDLDERAARVPFYTSVGYPVVHQRYDAARQHFAPLATVFSGLGVPAAEYGRISTGLFTPHANLAVHFNPRRVVTPDGIIALKNQQGLSGGGLWRFESLADPTAVDKLVAITIYAQHVGLKALVGTRIALFIAAILDQHPELASHLPDHGGAIVRVRRQPADEAP